jgi:hypothetical protein
LRYQNFPEGLELVAPGATPETLAKVEQILGITLPDDYRAFLRAFNGGTGFLAGGRYAVLWDADELVERNVGYEIKAFCPGYLLIGSDGGGEAIAVRLDSAAPEYVVFPFIGGPEHAISGVPSLEAFLGRFAAGELV